MIDKLNPETPTSSSVVDTPSARWLGYGAILVLYGAVVSGALLVRTRSRRPARPTLLDLALIAAGLVGLFAVGERVYPRGLKAVAARRPEEGGTSAKDVERFSHPAINVQRISFA